MKKNREIREKGLSFIISAGTYPGLSEIFPAYIAANYFDDVHRLELFFTGNGGFSLNAAYDIVCSIAEDNGAGMTYCENGRARKITGEFHKSAALPHPAGKRDAYPIINEEFRRIAERHGIKSAYFYNTYQNRSVLSKFVMIKALEQYKTEEEKKKSATILAEEYGIGESAPDDFTMFHMIAAGRKDGKPAQLASNMLYQNNWNALSGVVAANAARLLLEKDAIRSGCFFVAEGIDVTRMMNLLSGQNVYIRNSALQL
jgi:saccharopine dehydrogenase-like NADP-dependent oxidoreductase